MVGHNGEVHEISDINRKITLKELDNMHEKIYNDFIVYYQEKDVSLKKALDFIYKKGVFNYEKK